MKQNYLKITVFILIIFSFGCKGDLSPVDYVNWIEDESNGVTVRKEIGDYFFAIQYKPLDYLAVKNLRKVAVTEEEISKEKEELKDLQYYTLQIGLNKGGADVLKANLSEGIEYSQRIEYLSFQMQQDLSLVEGGDTLACLLHHFERTYGISPYVNIVLAFERKKEEQIPPVEDEDKTLVFNDQIFDLGRVKLTISGDNLKNIPQLKTI